MGFWQGLVRILGSLHLVVILMVVLMCGMVAGTLLESARGAAVARAGVYQAWWFIGLLVLLAVNLLIAMVQRWPFQHRLTGFLITHAAIVVILAGAMISYLWGEHGWLNLAEGRSANRMVTSRQVLAVESGPSVQEFGLDIDPRDPASCLPPRFPLNGGGELIQQQYMPNSRWVEGYEAAEAPAASAVELVLPHEGGQVSRWVSMESPDNQVTVVGSLPVRLRVIEGSDELAAVLTTQSASSPATSPTSAACCPDKAGAERALTTAPADEGYLTITVDDTTQTISVAGSIGKSVSLPGEDLTIKIVRYVPHAVVGPGGRIENQSDRPINPLVVCEVSGPEGSERQMVFVRFPQFQNSAMHRRKLKYPQVRVRFDAPFDRRQPSELELVLASDGRLYFVLHLTDHEKISGAVVEGQPLAAELRVDLRVAQVLPHARPVEEARELPYDPKRDGEGATPSVQVVVQAEGDRQSLWLPFGRRRPVRLGEQTMHLSFRQQEKILPFRVKLEEFAIDRYAGTQRPAMFRSRVVLTDPQRGVVVRKAIEMNDPLSYRGFDLCQSSYRTDGRETISVLGVSRDPGWGVILVGYVMLILGMAITLGTRTRSYLNRVKGASANG